MQVSVHPLMQHVPLKVLKQRVHSGAMQPINFATVRRLCINGVHILAWAGCDVGVGLPESGSDVWGQPGLREGLSVSSGPRS